MSEKYLPEVGDVFESPFAKYFVVITNEVYSQCVVEEQGFIGIRDIITHYLPEKCKYLGKSRVSIKELFDVAED